MSFENNQINSNNRTENRGFMPLDWEVSTVENISSEMRDAPFGAKLKSKDYVDRGIPVVQGRNIQNNRFEWNNKLYVSGEKRDELSKHLCRTGELVFPKVGTIGGCAILPVIEKKREFVLSTNMMKINVDENVNSLRYIYYYFSNPKIQNTIKQYSTSSVQPVFNFTSLKKFPVVIPSLSEQRSIADILTSLDNKIELNNAINKNLEEMAQALFKRWFVDFEFPNENGEPYKSSGGEFEESELGLIPKGWRVSSLDQVINIRHGYAFKSEYFSDGKTDRILLTPGNFKVGGGFIDKKFKYYSTEIDLPEDYVLKEGDMLVTMTDLSKAGDTLGYPAIIPIMENKKILHNQRLGLVCFTTGLPLKYFLYNVFCTNEYRGHILGTATGSTVKHTAPNRIESFKTVIAEITILQKYNDITKNIFELLSRNYSENNFLVHLRDSLLPKLMSGEIRAPLEQS